MQILPWIPIPSEIVLVIVAVIIVVIVVIVGIIYGIGKGIDVALDYRTGRMIIGTIILLLSPFVTVINFFIPFLGILILAVGVVGISEGIRWVAPLYIGILWTISVPLFNMILVNLTGTSEVIIFFLLYTIILSILGWISILVGLPLCIGMGAYTLHKRSRRDTTVSPKQKSEPTTSLGNCPKCSKAVEPDWEHCPDCGTPLD